MLNILLCYLWMILICFTCIWLRRAVGGQAHSCIHHRPSLCNQNLFSIVIHLFFPKIRHMSYSYRRLSGEKLHWQPWTVHLSGSPWIHTMHYCFCLQHFSTRSRPPPLLESFIQCESINHLSCVVWQPTNWYINTWNIFSMDYSSFIHCPFLYTCIIKYTVKTVCIRCNDLLCSFYISNLHFLSSEMFWINK